MPQRIAPYWFVLLPQILLGLDVLFQFFLAGGYSMVALAWHGSLTLLAALLLLLQKPTLRLPWLAFPLLGLPLLPAALHFLHLPASWLPYFNPVKAELLRRGQELFPFLKASPDLAVNPILHALRAVRMVFDLLFVLILLAMERPSKRLFSLLWRSLCLIVFGVATLQEAGFPMAASLMRYFQGTHGGIVNSNHFGTCTILLLLGLVAVHASSLRSLVHSHRRGELRQDHFALRSAVLVLDGFLLLLGLWAWRLSHSRAGLLLLVVAGALLACLLLWRPLGRSRWLLLPGAICAAGTLLLFAPLGQPLAKLQKEGLSYGNRLEAMAVATRYLAQRPLLGCGFGAAHSLLQGRVGSTQLGGTSWREVHNEYLQLTLEWGIPGLVWLVTGLVATAALARRILSDSAGASPFLSSLLCMVVVLGLHGLSEFPLRNPAIKTSFLLFLGFSLKQGWPQLGVPRRWMFGVLVGFSTCAAFALWTVAGWVVRPVPNWPALRDQAQFAVRYGRIFELDLLQATATFQDLLAGRVEGTLEEQLAILRSQLQRHYLADPCSLHAFNLLLAAEVVETRLLGTTGGFAALEEKALALEEWMGGPRNSSATLALFFLYETYADQLDEERLSRLAEMKKSLRMPKRPSTDQ
jgi:O-antigen ligase